MSRRHALPADVGERVRDRLKVVGGTLHELDRRRDLLVVRVIGLKRLDRFRLPVGDSRVHRAAQD